VSNSNRINHLQGRVRRAKGVLTNLEAWIRRRLRSYLWRQGRNGHTRFNELRRRGVPKFHAAVAAGSPTSFWRMSGHPAVQRALRNHYFDSLRLPRLHDSMSLSQLNSVEPPWYATRMPGGVGGWHREVSPYPDQCALSAIWNWKIPFA
jgi:hypothetical protein